MSAKLLPFAAALLAELRKLEQSGSPAPWKTVRNNGAQIGQGEEWNSRIIWSGPLHMDLAYLPGVPGQRAVKRGCVGSCRRAKCAAVAH